MRSQRVLHYVVAPTRFGEVSVVMSRDGVLDVILLSGDSMPSSTLPFLRSQYPDSLLVPDDGSRGSWAAAVIARLEGASPGVMAPLDLGPSVAARASAMTPDPVEMRCAS
jgi:hypothetical protein